MTKFPTDALKEPAAKVKKKRDTSAVKVALTASADTGAGPARGVRRKLQTRERLLDAALKLMSRKGMEGVAINEITDWADVGFGSFYNHFESKEAIYIALIDKFFEDFANVLEESLTSFEDPAEIIAASIRHTVNRASDDAVWGRFLLREGLSTQALTRGLGRRLLRDIQNGVSSGRFGAADSTMCFLAVGGTVLTAIAARLAILEQTETQTEALLSEGNDLGPLDQRTSTMCLQILGLTREEALVISGRALHKDT